MAIEKVSFGAASLPQKPNNTVKTTNTINEQQQRGDTVDISSKKDKKPSKGKALAIFCGSLLLAGGFGALTHKFITTRPSFVRKEMADTLGRKLTADEIAKIDKKCKKTYTGWDFFDDIITTFMFI